jgi:hypothetical protein
MIENKEKLSVNEAIDELLKTSVLQKVANMNDSDFALKLAIWLIRYSYVISKMNKSSELSFEDILQYIHGKELQKILQVKEVVSFFT